MGPVEAFTTGWRKSFDYTGKATRAEFWWWYLFNFIASIVFAGIKTNADFGNFGLSYFGLTAGIFFSLVSILISFYFLGQIFPTLSISVRRLRDAGKHWTWIFISLIPFTGFVWYLILMCQPSESSE